MQEKPLASDLNFRPAEPSADAPRFTDFDFRPVEPVYVRDWNPPSWRVAFLIVGAPFLVLGFGATAAWVARGFRGTIAAERRAAAEGHVVPETRVDGRSERRMITMQRLVLVAVGLGAVVMLLFPPFYMRYANGVTSNLGYHFLFDPPNRSRIVGLVHVPTLSVQFLVLFIVGGSMWFLAGTAQSRRKGAPASARSDGTTLAGKRVKFNPPRVVDSEVAAEIPHDGPPRSAAAEAAKAPQPPAFQPKFNPEIVAPTTQENAVHSARPTPQQRSLKAELFVLLLVAVAVAALIAGLSAL